MPSLLCNPTAAVTVLALIVGKLLRIYKLFTVSGFMTLHRAIVRFAVFFSLVAWRGVVRGVGTVLLMMLIGLGGGLGAIAAEAEAMPPPAETAPAPSAEVSATDIPAEKVNQFVSAYLAVVALIDRRSDELQRAETEAESLRLQQSIQAEAFSLIETSGLTRQDYWQLLGLANSDAEFRDRILAQIEEAGS